MLPDTHVLLSFNSESEPRTPSLSSQTQAHPYAVVFHLLCDPDVLKIPLTLQDSAKRQKSGPQTSLYSHSLTRAWHTGQLINIFQIDG